MRAFSRAWQTALRRWSWILGLEHQKLRDRLAGRVRVQFEKRRLVAGRLHYGQPISDKPFFVEVMDVEQQLQIDVHETRDVFGALNVTRHPI